MWGGGGTFFDGCRVKGWGCGDLIFFDDMFIKSCLNLTDFLIFRGTGPELVARFFLDMFIINSFIHLIISFPGVAKHLTFIGYKEGRGLVFFSFSSSLFAARGSGSLR